MQMVAADWLRSDKREDDLAGRPESIVQVFFIFHSCSLVASLFMYLFFYDETLSMH